MEGNPRLMLFLNQKAAQKEIGRSGKKLDLRRFKTEHCELATEENIEFYDEENVQWIIFSKGHFVVTTGEMKDGGIRSDNKLAGKEVLMLFVPKGKKCHLEAKSLVAYSVTRGIG